MSVDQVEWTWTIVNAAGLIFLSLVIRELLRDRRASSQATLDALGLTNGRRGIWVVILLRHEVLFFVLQALSLWSGVAAIMRDNPADPIAAATSIAFGQFAIAAALLMDAATLLDLRDRARIRSYKPRTVHA